MHSIARGLVAASALLFAGCVSFPSEGGTLGILGRTLAAEDESGPGAGVEVLSVPKESPLAAEGVRRGDVVTALEGLPVATLDDLVERVYRAGHASAVRVTVGPPGAGREVSVVPAKAARKLTFSLGIPFLFRIQGDRFEFLPLNLFSVGTGPDYEGFELVNCLGYANGPESRHVSLVILGFGTRISPEPAEPSKGGEPGR